MINIYTDGSARGNGKEENIGGWGMAVFVEDVLKYTGSSTSFNTTNNREEFKAIIGAIDYIQSFETPVSATIYSDSAYCLNTINDWMYRWEAKNWTKADKKVPENLDLVQYIFNKIKNEHNINFVKVKGHCGLPGNELADALATGNMKQLNKVLDFLQENGKVSSDYLYEFDL